MFPQIMGAFAYALAFQYLGRAHLAETLGHGPAIINFVRLNRWRSSFCTLKLTIYSHINNNKIAANCFIFFF